MLLNLPLGLPLEQGEHQGFGTFLRPLGYRKHQALRNGSSDRDTEFRRWSPDINHCYLHPSVQHIPKMGTQLLSEELPRPKTSSLYSALVDQDLRVRQVSQYLRGDQ